MKQSLEYSYQTKGWFSRLSLALLVLLPMVLVVSALLSLVMNVLFYELWRGDVQVCEGCPVFPVEDFLMFWGYTGFLGLAPAAVSAVCAASTRLHTRVRVIVSAISGPLICFLPSLLVLDPAFSTAVQSVVVLSSLVVVASGMFWGGLSWLSRKK